MLVCGLLTKRSVDLGPWPPCGHLRPKTEILYAKNPPSADLTVQRWHVFNAVLNMQRCRLRSRDLNRIAALSLEHSRCKPWNYADHGVYGASKLENCKHDAFSQTLGCNREPRINGTWKVFSLRPRDRKIRGPKYIRAFMPTSLGRFRLMAKIRKTGVLDMAMCLYRHTHEYRLSLHTYICIYITNICVCLTYINTYIDTYIHTYIRSYMHACMHGCMHAYIHTYTHTDTHAYTYAYTNTIYIYIYIYTYIRTLRTLRTYVHTNKHTCIHTYIHTQVHTYIHTITLYTITLHCIELHCITYMTRHYIT